MFFVDTLHLRRQRKTKNVNQDRLLTLGIADIWIVSINNKLSEIITPKLSLSYNL